MRELHDRIGRAEAVVAATFLLMMVGLIFAGGLARLAAHPINWAIDLATCLFAWACFLCADIAWRRDSLMSITLVSERLPVRFQRYCLYLNYLLIAGFLMFVIVGGI